jgi:hypothetical protein
MARKASRKPAKAAPKRARVRPRFLRETIEEIEIAYQRLNALFAEAEAAGDRLAALNAQKELNRLGGLYPAPKPEADPEAAPDPLALVVERYLVPLRLLPAGAPPAEHIRVAAERLGDLLDDP